MSKVQPCPHCQEKVPIATSQCPFCSKPIDFERVARERQKRNEENLRRLQKMAGQGGQSGGSAVVGILTGILALGILSASLAGFFALDSGEVTPGTVALGILLGVGGMLFAVHNIFASLAKGRRK